MRRNKSRKEKRKPKTKQQRKKITDRPTTRRHGLYGLIPLIYEDGYPRCDPDFRPKLPPNAVRGNVSKQFFYRTYYTPKYFYVDELVQCRDCGCHFIFSPQTQKFWYEERRLNFSSKPLQCIECRNKKRSNNILRDQMTAVANAVTEKPTDPQALVAYAETVLTYHSYFAQGNLEKAIAATRKAYKLSPDLFEALFWNAACLEAAGHFAKARKTYQQFLDAAANSPSHATYLSRAEQQLAQLTIIPIESDEQTV